MSPTKDQIAQLAAGRVLVVGDVMVDHYVSGRVSRVSDEAPVPIIHVADERWTAGGAANVAANVAALGGKAMLVGVTGGDAAASTLAGILSDLSRSIETHLVTEPGRPTTIKTRYMGGQHQIVRVDREHPGAIGKATEDRIMAAVDMLAGDCDAIMISDYAKGVLTDRVLAAVFAAGRKAGVPVIVDPKRNDWLAYRGAAIITPNRKELQLATHASCGSDAECANAADQAISTVGAAILLTRSEHGMSLFRAGAQPLHLAAKAREVFDVSGAGDTVAAAVSLGVASGLPIETAMQLANIAAGIVVAKRGTAIATPAELLAEIGAGRRGAGSAPGALPLAEARKLREDWGRQGMTVGFTNGCFDILHAGHISLLRQAAEGCDRLIVALNTDASVRVLKGPERPVQSEDVRASVMASIKGVDAVILFGEQTPLEVIRELQPDVLIKGADYSEDQIVGADIVRARGGRILRVTLVDGQSTTKVIEKSRKPSKG
ncbi:MAG TPA: D-glycero-beta-D-manno-heptose-7-phosphate kinase [Hyphomonadaceae bacterium]|nr:D-glycero-beta-D-manno-heptose-7-phosphate kinase [Hyphomonadaceae bacterium]